MNLHRGDVVTCAFAGEFGKPRPAIVLQSDLFNATHASVTLCPVTSHLLDAPLFRVPLAIGQVTGLKVESHAMLDKLATVRLVRVKSVIGRLESEDLERVETAVMRWLGLRA
ncbi:MAG: type II toxin-antitoxin system PemK/MazF family toxin [Lacunisphaera sp.]|nr:type II toxin-antitoxin system PemK/MazF family toxin [Lacunisphaera sp.]